MWGTAGQRTIQITGTGSVKVEKTLWYSMTSSLPSKAEGGKNKQTQTNKMICCQCVWLTAVSRPPLPQSVFLPSLPLVLSLWLSFAEVRCVCDCSACVRFQEITCHTVVTREAGVHWTFPGIPPDHSCTHKHKYLYVLHVWRAHACTPFVRCNVNINKHTRWRRWDSRNADCHLNSVH